MTINMNTQDEFISNYDDLGLHSYENAAVLAKLVELAQRIKENPNVDIIFEIATDRFIVQVLNAPKSYVDNMYGFAPGLMLQVDFNPDTYQDEQYHRDSYNRFIASELFGGFITKDKMVPADERSYYKMFEYDAEACCECMLKTAYLIGRVSPADAHQVMKWYEYQNSLSEKAKSGCAGIMALMLVVTGAVTYGVVELLSNLIA